VSPLQTAQAIVEQHQGWTWATIVSTALASWIAPIAGIVTIGLGLLQGYIAWKKYRHWQKTQDTDA
jgi:hypothetical protein